MLVMITKEDRGAVGRQITATRAALTAVIDRCQPTATPPPATTTATTAAVPSPAGDGSVPPPATTTAAPAPAPTVDPTATVPPPLPAATPAVDTAAPAPAAVPAAPANPLLERSEEARKEVEKHCDLVAKDLEELTTMFCEQKGEKEKDAKITTDTELNSNVLKLVVRSRKHADVLSKEIVKVRIENPNVEERKVLPWHTDEVAHQNVDTLKAKLQGVYQLIKFIFLTRQGVFATKVRTKVQSQAVKPPPQPQSKRAPSATAAGQKGVRGQSATAGRKSSPPKATAASTVPTKAAPAVTPAATATTSAAAKTAPPTAAAQPIDESRRSIAPILAPVILDASSTQHQPRALGTLTSGHVLGPLPQSFVYDLPPATPLPAAPSVQPTTPAAEVVPVALGASPITAVPAAAAVVPVTAPATGGAPSSPQAVTPAALTQALASLADEQQKQSAAAAGITPTPAGVAGNGVTAPAAGTTTTSTGNGVAAPGNGIGVTAATNGVTTTTTTATATPAVSSPSVPPVGTAVPAPSTTPVVATASPVAPVTASPVAPVTAPPTAPTVAPQPAPVPATATVAVVAPTATATLAAPPQPPVAPVTDRSVSPSREPTATVGGQFGGGINLLHGSVPQEAYQQAVQDDYFYTRHYHQHQHVATQQQQIGGGAVPSSRPPIISSASTFRSTTGVRRMDQLPTTAMSAAQQHRHPSPKAGATGLFAGKKHLTPGEKRILMMREKNRNW